MNDKNKKSIRAAVLARIKNEQVVMRPKWHFVLKGALAIVGMVIFALALVYLASFIFFVLQQTGLLFVPALGFRGMGVFLVSLPWLLVLLSLVFIIVLEIFMKHYAFGYRRPLLYSVLGITILVLAGSFTISRTDLHQNLLKSAEARKLPIAGQLYRGYGMQKLDDVHMGVIEGVVEDGFRIISSQGETFTVQVSPDTRLPSEDDLEEGDRIVVLGMREDHIIRALGIRKIDDDRNLPRAPQSGRRAPFSPTPANVLKGIPE